MMRWEPLAGTMISWTCGSAILRIVSAKGPVALMTCKGTPICERVFRGLRLEGGGGGVDIPRNP